MKIKNIQQSSDILYNSRVQLKRISNLPEDCRPINKTEAYLIQESLVNKYLTNNKAHVIGKKVGCTNKLAQKQINVLEPFYGSLISNYSSRSNCDLYMNNFFMPYLEPEFSFKIKNNIDLSKIPYSFDEIYNSIDSVLPSIEIVDSRFHDWKIVGINNLIADNGVNAYWIYGEEKKDLRKFDFSNHSVKVYINNKLVEKGNSRDVLENPINSLNWLINSLKKYNGTLYKGDYVSTGTCTVAIPINKNDKVCADFGELGKVIFNLI